MEKQGQDLIDMRQPLEGWYFGILLDSKIVAGVIWVTGVTFETYWRKKKKKFKNIHQTYRTAWLCRM